MSKQEAMEFIFEYLTTWDHPGAAGLRTIDVNGDGEGPWSVELKYANGESARGDGADFAEALEAARLAPIC